MNAVTQNSSGWFFDSTHADASASPAVPAGAAQSFGNNTATISEIDPTGTDVDVVGAVHFTGSGVSFNTATNNLHILWRYWSDRCIPVLTTTY